MTNEELVKAVQQHVGKKFSGAEILAEALAVVRLGLPGDVVELTVERLKA